MESGAEVIEALQELKRASGKRVKCKPMAELSQTSKGADAITPRIELHADCYAGLRAGQSKITTALDPGDIKEALGAAGALGDDRLQERVKGFAVATSFSHRTRPCMTWFKRAVQVAICAAVTLFLSTACKDSSVFFAGPDFDSTNEMSHLHLAFWHSLVPHAHPRLMNAVGVAAD